MEKRRREEEEKRRKTHTMKELSITLIDKTEIALRFQNVRPRISTHG